MGKDGRKEAKAGWDPRAADRKSPRAPGHRPARTPRPDEEGPPVHPQHGRQRLYGFHSVAEALRNPARKVHALYCTENALQRLGEMVDAVRPSPTLLRPDDLARLVEGAAVHQGIVADVEPLPGRTLDDLPDNAIVVVLDQVTDPHNVGAILRSAAAFGAAALVTTDRHSPGETGVLAKAASGGLEHVAIITVGNLAQALATLGERGFWRVGLDSDGPAPLEASLAPRPLAIVLGAEGKGLRRLTRERCDVLARLDVPGALRSLNVSNAAAVALYAIHRSLSGPG